jgi:transposase
MDVVSPRCCGLDLHKKSVVACRIVPTPDGPPRREVRTFGTMTHDLLSLADWLTEAGVTHVAMESTGVYWKPIYNLLEGSFQLLVVNAQHIKAVPGRKSDVNDAEWIATLLRHGLLKASFIPDLRQRQLRDLTRYRTSLVRERAAEVNRLQKRLEGANLKLASVVTDVTDRSARQILAALVAGQTDPVKLTEQLHGRLQEKKGQLQQALLGRFGAHERFLVGQQVAHLDELEKRIGAVSFEIVRRLGEPPAPTSGGAPEAGSPPPTQPEGGQESEGSASPAEEAIARLMTIPGVGRRTAELLVAEIGTDMSRFPSPGHLASWAGMVPGQNESAGKRKSSQTRRGSPWLRSGLVEAAQAAGRTKGSALGAQYQRLAARRGKKRAVVAVGHTILVIAYHLLNEGTRYEERGGNYLDERDREATKRQLVRRLERLGHKVTIEPLAAA